MWNDPRFAQGAAAPSSSVKRLEPASLAATGFKDDRFSFQKIAKQLVANGWPVFPQANGKDRRFPGEVIGVRKDQGGGTIEYKTVHKLHRKLPKMEALELWMAKCQEFNTALATGEAWGEFGVFSLDLDIYDPFLAKTIYQLAVQHFGYTPFIRGRASVPKLALLFRRPRGALRLPSKKFRLEARYEGLEQLIEIGDDGQPITIYGYHHSDGDRFEWMGEAEPWSHGADVAPMATEAQVMAFLADVNRISPIQKFGRQMKEYEAAPVEWGDADVREIRAPPMTADAERAVKLTDGRKDWLFKRSTPWARINAGLVAPLKDGKRTVSRTAVRMLASKLFEESIPHIDYNSLMRPMTQHAAIKLIEGHLASAAQKVAEGVPGFEPIGTRRISTETNFPQPVIGQRVLQSDDEFAWLPNKRRPIEGFERTEPDTALAKVLALLDDRRAEMDRVYRETRARIMKWLVAVSEHDPKADELAVAWLVKAPTGSGKTTALIQCIADFKRMYPERRLGPILMLMPSYANIAEVVGREDLGVYTAEQLDRAAEIIIEAETIGVRAMIYRGKKAGGCYEEKRLELLMNANVNTSGLCHTHVCETEIVDGDKNSVKVEKHCRWHPENPDRDESKPACPVILQQFEVPLSDLVLAPHAFIHTNLPSALKDVAAYVVDEKIWDKTISVRQMPVESLINGRGEPQLTRKEKADGKIDAFDRLRNRDRLGEIAAAALRGRLDVFNTSMEHNDGRAMIDDARWVTGRLQRAAMDVTPDTPLFEIREYVSRPVGRHLADEHKLWGLLQERLEAKDEGTGPGVFAAETDARIYMLEDETVVMAYRRELNFQGKPVLFLDASGHAGLLSKIWGRKVEEFQIKASLHLRVVLVPDRTFAKTNILPTAEDAGDKQTAKAASLQWHREAVNTIALAYADGGVVGGMPMNVRRHLLEDWAEPVNVDSMHYGAIRGLDFAKKHVAAFSFGQVELRDTDLDAIVTAISYDDEAPEMRTNPFGNGMDEHGDPIKRPTVTKRYPLRDGGEALVKDVYEPQGRWARIITHQVREEEISQFGGRLRPVYRAGRAPVWVHFGKVLPEGLVVDEVVSLMDLARPFGTCNPVLEEVTMSGLMTRDSVGHFMISGVSDTQLQTAFDVISSSDRWTRSWHTAEYHVKGDDAPRKAFIPGYLVPDLAALRDAVSHLDLIDEPRIAREARKHAFNRRKEADKVELELAPRAERLENRRLALQMLDARIDRGDVKFDKGGVKKAGMRTTVSPGHLITLEGLVSKIERLKIEQLEASKPVITVDQQIAIDEAAEKARLSAELTLDDGFVSHAEHEAAVEAAVEKAINDMKRQLGVTLVSTAPAPANSSEPVQELAENVDKLKIVPKFRPMKAFTLPRTSASA